MKKILCLFLTMLLLVSAVTPVMASGEIKVKINGKQIAFDVQPQLINNRTMVPLRAIFEALGATVNWNNDTQTVTSTKGGTTISLTINSPKMYVNGTPVALDSPACLVSGRTLVPVRAISEAFKLKVDWIGDQNTVSISTNSGEGAKDLCKYIEEKGVQKGIGYYIVKTEKLDTITLISEIRYLPSTNSLEFLIDALAGSERVSLHFTFDPKTKTISKNRISGTISSGFMADLETSADAKKITKNTDFTFTAKALLNPNAQFDVSVYNAANSVLKTGFLMWEEMVESTGNTMYDIGFELFK